MDVKDIKISALEYFKQSMLQQKLLALNDLQKKKKEKRTIDKLLT